MARATLTNASFDGSLVNSPLGSSAQGSLSQNPVSVLTNMSGLDLSGDNLSAADKHWIQVDFTGANLAGTTFKSDGHFDYSVFARANLAATAFPGSGSGVRFQSANFTGATGVPTIGGSGSWGLTTCPNGTVQNTACTFP